MTEHGRRQIKLGWGTVADGLTWALGAVVALWPLLKTGDIPPGAATFAAGCILGTAARRALWSPRSTEHGGTSPEQRP